MAVPGGGVPGGDSLGGGDYYYYYGIILFSGQKISARRRPLPRRPGQPARLRASGHHCHCDYCHWPLPLTGSVVVVVVYR
jgi:hypothetical protein